MKILSLDFETNVGNTIHGSGFRDVDNDIITQIHADHPDRVIVQHCADGYNRRLSSSAALSMANSDLIVGHNLEFDLSYIWHDPTFQLYIQNGGKIWCCQVAEYLLTGQQHTFSSLAELQLKYLGEKEKPSRISWLYKKGVGADKIVKARDRCPRLFALYEFYCKSDGRTPLLIWKAQYTRAKAEGMLPIIELYNDYLLSIINMTCTGIKIDVAATERTFQDFNIKYLTYLQEAHNILKQVWTDERLPTFNINSPVHKSAVLFGGNIPIDVIVDAGFYKNGKKKTKKGVQLLPVKGFALPLGLTSKTKKEGVYSTDDSVMKAIALKTTSNEIKEYCELQKKAMMHKKAANTYCKAFLDRHVDGILYPNFNNTLTQTGRLSSSEPNMMNVSKRNEFGKVLHSLFIPAEGWACCQIDFSQLEIWVLAWLSNDLQLIEDLQNGVDLHVKRLQYYNDKTYEELYKLCKIDKDPYWDKQRTYAKTVSYQMAYGAQPKKVAESTGLDLSVVETIFAKEAETYSDTAALAVQVQESIKRTATFSKSIDIPRSSKGKNILGNVELLPVFDNYGNACYTNQEIRKVGYWTSPTGKKYHFLDSGRMTRNGLQRGFSFTQPKNYPMQGSAADIQGATTAALLSMLLKKKDKIKMINEIHDSKWFYVRTDVLEPCLKELRSIIENVPKIMLERFNITVPFNFPVDIQIGSDFGDMYDWKG